MSNHQQSKIVLCLRAISSGGATGSIVPGEILNDKKVPPAHKGKKDPLKKEKLEFEEFRKKRTYKKKKEDPIRETKEEVFSRRVKSRHMYTKEEQRFVYFYRYVLNMKPVDCHRFFNEYFGHNLGVTALNQLAGRMKNLQLDEIINWKHTEDWAVGECCGQVDRDAARNDGRPRVGGGEISLEEAKGNELDDDETEEEELTDDSDGMDVEYGYY